MLVWQNLLGLIVLSAAAGLGLQILAALVLLKMPIFKDFFMLLGDSVQAVLAATRIGTTFVFGYLGGGNLPFDKKFPGFSFILAFQALPLILVMSALSALLFH